jgi:hypothetical protein
MSTTTTDRVGGTDQIGSRSTRQLGGWLTILGAVGMLVGAGFSFASGADADVAIESGDVAAYLTAANDASTLLVINLSVWIVAICVLCVGGLLLAGTSEDGVARRVSAFAFTTGAGTAVMFFSLWMGVVLALAPAYATGESVESVALALLHGAVNADWVITVLILSVGGGFMVLSGQTTWAPNWLVRWAYLAFVAGAFALAGIAVGFRSLPIAVVPIGLGMLIAAGTVAVRGRV